MSDLKGDEVWAAASSRPRVRRKSCTAALLARDRTLVFLSVPGEKIYRRRTGDARENALIFREGSGENLRRRTADLGCGYSVDIGRLLGDEELTKLIDDHVETHLYPVMGPAKVREKCPDVGG